jgi:hypothetical protein
MEAMRYAIELAAQGIELFAVAVIVVEIEVRWPWRAHVRE